MLVLTVYGDGDLYYLAVIPQIGMHVVEFIKNRKIMVIHFSSLNHHRIPIPDYPERSGNAVQRLPFHLAS